MTDERLQGYTLRLGVMKEVLAELEETIVDAEAKDYFLSMPKNWLDDVEQFLANKEPWQIEVAAFTLTLVEKQLVRVKKLTTSYGSNIRIGGGG